MQQSQAALCLNLSQQNVPVQLVPAYPKTCDVDPVVDLLLLGCNADELVLHNLSSQTPMLGTLWNSKLAIQVLTASHDHDEPSCRDKDN